MTWFPQTLWDLLPRPFLPVRPGRESQRRGARRSAGEVRRSGMRERYDVLVVDMKRLHTVRIRKWRKTMSGCAWEIHYTDGGSVNLIEAPYPKGPMSCAIFLHEIGHHAIGFGRYRPRCLEEYHAWRWALETMRERGFNVTDAVRQRMAESLRYAVAKARRRGLRRIPPELIPYLRPTSEAGTPGQHARS